MGKNEVSAKSNPQNIFKFKKGSNARVQMLFVLRFMMQISI